MIAEKDLLNKIVQDKKLAMFEKYNGEDKVVMIQDFASELAKKPKKHKFLSGLGELDDLVDGFRGGEVVVVSGPTGQGKTTFLQTLTYSFADQGVSCLWFSYEVGAEDFVERFDDRIPAFSLPMQTVPSNLKWLESKIWEGKAKFGAKVIFVDHLHFLMDLRDMAGMNSSLAIGFMMREIKRIAIETDSIIFLVSHIKKIDVDVQPETSDLRDSSFVGQESDMVFMVWRQRDENTKKFGTKSYLKITKNRRKGNLDLLHMNFIKNKFYIVQGETYE